MTDTSQPTTQETLSQGRKPQEALLLTKKGQVRRVKRGRSDEGGPEGALLRVKLV